MAKLIDQYASNVLRFAAAVDLGLQSPELASSLLGLSKEEFNRQINELTRIKKIPAWQAPPPGYEFVPSPPPKKTNRKGIPIERAVRRIPTTGLGATVYYNGPDEQGGEYRPKPLVPPEPPPPLQHPPFPQPGPVPAPSPGTVPPIGVLPPLPPPPVPQPIPQPTPEPPPDPYVSPGFGGGGARGRRLAGELETRARLNDTQSGSRSLPAAGLYNRRTSSSQPVKARLIGALARQRG